MKPFTLTVDVPLVSVAYGYSIAAVKQHLVDGRKRGFEVEDMIASLDGFEKAPSENLPYDVIWKKTFWEIRSITSNVKFSPAKSHGTGRNPNQKDIREKWNAIDGFLLVDTPIFIGQNALLKVYPIPITTVQKWSSVGRYNGLGSRGIMERNKLLRLISAEGIDTDAPQIIRVL